MKRKKLAALLLTAAMAVTGLAGCGGNASTGNSGNTVTGGSETTGTTDGDSGTSESFVKLDPQTEGDLSIMVWSGDGEYYEDIGHQNLEAENITAQNVASLYAMAKKFNETYPNVKINVYAKSGDPNANDTSWQQEMENFKAQHLSLIHISEPTRP